MSEEITRERDELDEVIDRCKMIERTGLSRDELHQRVQKATICLNMAHCLSDVIETLVMDAECILQPFGATFDTLQTIIESPSGRTEMRQAVLYRFV